MVGFFNSEDNYSVPSIKVIINPLYYLLSSLLSFHLFRNQNIIFYSEDTYVNNLLGGSQPRATAEDARKVAIVKKLVNEWVIGPTQGHKVDLRHRKGA